MAEDEPAPIVGPILEREASGGMAGEAVPRVAARSGCSDIVDAAPPASPTRRAGVTVEQGEGWSLEIWPATAGVAATGGATRAQDPLHQAAGGVRADGGTAAAGGAEPKGGV
jgi:hypothetical protein